MVRLFLRLITLAAIAAAWIPFRAGSLGQTMAMLKSMFGQFANGHSYSVNFYLMTLFWCAWIAIEPMFGELIARMAEPGRPGFFRGLNGLLIRPTACARLLLLFLVFGERDMQFIYFQF